VNKESFFTNFHKVRIKEHSIKLPYRKFKMNESNVHVTVELIVTGMYGC